jgi:hypothetical protein
LAYHDLPHSHEGNHISKIVRATMAHLAIASRKSCPRKLCEYMGPCLSGLLSTGQWTLTYNVAEEEARSRTTADEQGNPSVTSPR